MFNGAKYVILILALVTVFAGGCSSANSATTIPPATTPSPATAIATPTQAQPSNLPDRVDVVYFQRGNACHCMAVIGENIQSVVYTDFVEESSAGKLTFKILASDDRANATMVRKYNTGPFGLFLTIVKGKTEKIVPVEEIWGMTGDEVKYMEYVKNLIDRGIKGEL